MATKEEITTTMTLQEPTILPVALFIQTDNPFSVVSSLYNPYRLIPAIK